MAKKEAATYLLKKNPVLNNVLDISTGHITANDDIIFKAAGDDTRQVPTLIIVYPYKEGYFVVTENTETALRSAELSGAAIFILTWAQAQGLKYVQFDADGTTYEDLPTFNW